MKKLAYLLFICIFIDTTIYAQGFLKASGKQIINDKGENVLLRGIGLGGWMLQEGYMLKLQGINPQYSIRKRIDSLLSPAQTQDFYDTWLSNFVTKEDIDSLHKWGFNSVRLPMHYNLFTLPVDKEPDSTKQTWLTKGFELTDSLLNWCKANNMYLILDLHAAPGGQGNDLNIADRDSTKPSLWESEANKIKTIALWKKLAERYKDEPNIGGYDLLNETNWGFDDANDKHGQKEINNKPLRELLMNITQAIRSVDTKHIIIIEGNAWGNNYKGVFPAWDKNIVVSFHKYWNNNDVQSIQHMLDTRNQYNVPVWIGETGENSNVWFTDAIKLYEENNIGWSWWPLKKIGNNNPLEIKSNLNYSRLVNFWNGKAAKPPKESDVYSGLLELAIYTNARSNIVHKDVIDAMFRQPFSTKTISFKPNIIDAKDSVINAVDYDLGRNGFAYADKDTGNYYISNNGKRNTGNKGYTYRNDGVDIYKDSSHYETYFVGNIEDSEWMHYTIDVTANGSYALKLVTASENNNGIISISVDDKMLTRQTAIASTGGMKDWQTQTIKTLSLNKGKHVIKVYADKGGFNFKQLVFVKQ